MVQSRSDHTGRSHSHGWGIAAYDGERPIVHRQAADAYHDAEFRDAAARTYSKTVIAHVRRATVGRASLDNTHPFSHGRWTFAHNGTIPHFDVVRERMLDEMAEDHRRAVAGDTDSEHFFRLLLSQLDGGAEPVEEALTSVLRRVVDWCREVDAGQPIGLNVLITDGDTMAGCRWGRGLYFVTRIGVSDCEICGYPHIVSERRTDYRAVVVASEPLTYGEEWHVVPDGSVFSVGPDFTLKTRRIGRPTPREEPETIPAPVRMARTTLIDEFMVDHRALREGVLRLVEAVRHGDPIDIECEADRVDQISGAHIAFEEADLYPALGAGSEMYADHRLGARSLQLIHDAHGDLSEEEQEQVLEDAAQMVGHLEDCGVLLQSVSRLAPLVQSRLEDRLLEWRDVRPRWTKFRVIDVGG